MVHGMGGIPPQLSACANSGKQAFFLLLLSGLGTRLVVTMLIV